MTMKLTENLLEDAIRLSADGLMRRAVEARDKLVNETCLGAEMTGWFHWPKKKGQELLAEIESYVHNLDVNYDLVLIVGIGGSYLGTRSVTESLLHSYQGLVKSRSPLVAYAGHHISETQLVEVLELLDHRLPLINVISKSGTTTEPGVVFRVLRTYMEKRFGKEESARRIVCTTDAKKGALLQLAKECHYKTFSIPDNVGGRYSVLTAVGLLPLALLKLDIKAMLDGASDMFSAIEADDSHPALRYAALRNALLQSGKSVEILAINNPKFVYIFEWWKQLFGESEGKEGKGLFPTGLVYTTDLHSLGQFVQDGSRLFLETFLSFADDRPRRGGIEQCVRVPSFANAVDDMGHLDEKPINEINAAAMLGTMVAHVDGGCPSLGLQWPKLDEYNLGSLFAFFETACAVSGQLLDVNPYDQPGVEAYKKNLFALTGKPGTESLRTELKARIEARS